MSRRRTLVEIDPELLDAAKSLLGTTTIKDTIDRALREIVRSQVTREHRRDRRTLAGLDLADPEVMAQAWRPGT
jgi:Arc/MetJ family transcription regulator